MAKRSYLRMRRAAVKKSRIAGVLLFGIVLIAGSVTGLLLPLRPQVSQTEKRELARFPEFSVSGLMDGSYFSAISMWYSDSYPGRDFWIRGNDWLHRMDGIQTVQVIGAGKKGDEIPDAPLKQTDGSKEEASKGEISTKESFEQEISSEEVSGENSVPENETKQQGTDLAAESVPDGPQETAPPIIGQSVGGLFTMGDTAFEIYYFNRTAADLYINSVNRAAAALAGQTQVYEMLIPISAAYYMDQVTHDNLGASSEADAIAYYYASASDQVKTIPLYEELWNHVSDEYIFFRTDHHWNGPGAYYAYRAFAQSKGIAPHELSEYQKMEFGGFLGSLYNTCRSAAMEANPDTVWAYVPITWNRMTYTSRDGTEHEWDIINDVTSYTAGNKYSCFAAGDNPISVIRNPNAANGQTCLVVKESFGNALIPFLTDHYETIYWIDYRYYNGSITDFARANGVNDLIFANGIEVISDTASMERLSSLIP